ncbi:hypothetical protein BS50DRAFT_282664 [Corynespora cassiicola Philippines]|uniref:Uncharacterized protein n=1 Tax=Corynespora cassiicola Philippines TaxID=1448308 RepID=A0A2T2P189_CORCC|nr:hypothetical protein BS50DRAFT_282664 [Corynespora cassiicola Philippines]
MSWQGRAQMGGDRRADGSASAIARLASRPSARLILGIRLDWPCGCHIRCAAFPLPPRPALGPHRGREEKERRQRPAPGFHPPVGRCGARNRWAERERSGNGKLGTRWRERARWWCFACA